MVERNVITQKQ